LLLFIGKAQEFEAVYKALLVANNGPNRQRFQGRREVQFEGNDLSGRHLAIQDGADATLAVR